MPPKKKDANSSKILGLHIKGVYPDRNQELLEMFGKFTVEAIRPETVLLLLGSPEQEVVLSALHHIDIFCAHLPENAIKMTDFRILEILLEKEIFFSDNIFIKRFGFKIMSEVLECDNPSAPITDYSMIEQIFEIVKNCFVDLDSDSFVVEYSAVCLVSLLAEPRICITMEVDVEFITHSFMRLGSTDDPDILYQTYLILLKLIRCSTSLALFCSIQEFPFERVLGDVSCSYPDIQMAALHLIGELCECKSSEQYKRKFICLIFFDQLFKILEDEKEIMIMHLPVIQILKKLMKSEEIARVFCNETYPQRFYAFAKLQEEYLIESAGVFCEIAQHNQLVDILFQLGIVGMLTEIMNNKCSDITPDLCLGLKRMMKHPEACLQIIQDNPVPCLIRNLALDDNDWKTRETAADCLQALANRNKKLCESIFEYKFGPLAENLLDRPYREVPPDCIINVLQVLNALVVHPDIRNKIMDVHLAQSLIYAIKLSKRSGILVTNLFNCASAYICEEQLQNQFLKNNIAEILLPPLRSPALIVKTAAADFIMLTGRVFAFSEDYIDKNVLSSMLTDEKSLSICPSWSPAIESILTANPSLKFCIRGRLDISDLIGPNFYISKKHWKDFKVFRYIIKCEVSPLYPMIIVNFGHTYMVPTEVVRIGNISSRPTNASLTSTTSEVDDDWVYCRRPIDVDLPKYLKKLRDSLEIRGLMDNQKNCIDITKISNRAKLIADIVCNEMCGNKRGTQSQICSEHVVLNHLNYLKCQLHCSIIPLGRIRFGGYLERSLLFKALADQIGLPCTLRRNIDGRIMYNEIPIPTQEEHKKCATSNLPKRLLNPTHIIDLMDNQGELYPIDSPQAYRYLRLM